MERNTIMTAIEIQAAAAKEASVLLMKCKIEAKNRALTNIANALMENKQGIIEANEIDIKNARDNSMSPSLLDRLALDGNRIDAIAKGVLDVAAHRDPIGEIGKLEKRPNGLMIGRKIVPLGVVAIIYESRPNVTVDAAILCLKAGNAVILRGGKDAKNSNNALVNTMREAIFAAGLPIDLISLVQDTSRESVNSLMKLTEYVDVLIPRGGAGLINHVVNNSKIPVIETGVGNCHVYVEKSADLDMALDIIFNAKCRRVSVCNTAETLLVDEEIAESFLPMAKARLDTKNVQLRGCDKAMKILGSDVIAATDEDYYTEFLDYILAVKVVAGLDEAIAHIGKYSSQHSEAIVTNDYKASNRFLDEIDSAAVYVNASTAFTDGGEFGLGAEIGISTQKLHARGPMGLEQLTSTKFVIFGDGQVRD
jgi:glutamate-5-semialdehyde dehydrogenase